MRVLVTGAGGFVGRELCPLLAQSGHVVRAALRAPDSAVPDGVSERAVVGDISSRTDWREALSDVDAVVHLAARVHVMHDSPTNADAYLETNTRGTQRLADGCVAAGVTRLVFLSSIKVNGEETDGRAYTATDTPAPRDPYGESKWLAEKYLLELGKRSALQPVIVRPPLVHGPGVRANFLRLLQWVDREMPLPLGAIRNRRSIVSRANLCHFITLVLRHPAAAGRVWLIADDESPSTPQLIRRIAGTMGRRPRLIPVPVTLLKLVAALTGKTAEVRRLCGSLAVDITPARAELGWSPAVSLDEGLEHTVRAYLEARSARAE